MKENEILDEIHRIRAEHARECGYDVRKIFLQVREGTKKLEAEGWKVVSFGSQEPAETSYLIREESPKKNKNKE